MDRLLVALLSAFDAVIAAAVGVAAVLAPLTLVWVIGLGGGADWGALWSTSGSIWLFGNLAPLSITLDDLYVAQAGIDVDAAAFTLSLAPLAFAAFTAIFAARSGGRAAGAGAWITGVTTGALVYAAAAAAVVLTTANPIARVTPWQGIVLPLLLYGVAALGGAVVTAWRGGDDGLIDRLRDRLELLPHGWSPVPGLIARGTAIVVAGLVAAASIAVAVAVIARGDEVIALYESTHLDALGATLVTLGQLAYLPTLIVWAMAWLAGPGFALGVGTAVSPAGTQLGVVPGIPVLGLVPEEGSPWLLLVLLIPVAIGAVAGWAIRSRMLAAREAAAAPPPPIALTGLLPLPEAGPPEDPEAPEHEPIGPRLAVTAGIGVFAGACAALLAWAASGSLGPGRLAEVGPAVGPVALAVGFEVLIGAGILLLGPAAPPRTKHRQARAHEDTRPPGDEETRPPGDEETRPRANEEPPIGPFETAPTAPTAPAALAGPEDPIPAGQREATLATLRERLRAASHDEKPPVD
ncbi:MAG TPA: DUF6350 family protein [Microbacterium sp.]|uniref:cell division protein PerM n=1 Tax=Microbacterium sp. TaxID=51671 RepID=UPI002BEB896D|nr:DUF6350 family protein [Microbacterium sp.]HWI30117.1 DUF6350 family protein [Microbacterium sp.]